MAEFISFQPSDFFSTKLYTGNGSTQSITGVGFQPDLVWIKDRAAADQSLCLPMRQEETKVLLINIFILMEIGNKVRLILLF